MSGHVVSYKISVLMPVYNAELYIEQAIESILSQTFDNFEFIIINDGSTDNSENKINSYDDKRIVYIKNETNKGLIYSLNLGISLAKGKYIARMDADDISYTNRLFEQFNFMENNPEVSLLGTGFVFMNSEIEIYHPQLNDQIKVNLLRDTALAHPTVMFRRKDITKYNLSYKEKYKSAEDYKLWTDFAINNLIMANLPIVLLKYRQHSNQISTSKKEEQLNNTILIRKEYIRFYFSKYLDVTEVNLLSSDLSQITIYKALVLVNKIFKVNKEYNLFSEKSLDYYYNRLISNSKLNISFSEMFKFLFCIKTKKKIILFIKYILPRIHNKIKNR